MNAPKVRIAAALLFGFTLVIGSFILRANNMHKPMLSATATNTSTERPYIDVADSNHDGVADWRDELQTTDPIVVSSSTATTTKYQPTTVTGKFAVDFFKDYMNYQVYGSQLGTTPADLVNQETTRLAKQATDALFTEKDLSLFPSSDQQTLHDYGNQIASIILAHPSSTSTNELDILQEAVRYKQMDKLDELSPIELSYSAMVKDLLAAPVPKKYAKEHLDLLNAINAVREDIHAMHNVNEDALYALLRLKRYEDDVTGVSNALKQLFNTLYLQDTVRWQAGEPVSVLITFPQSQ